LWLGTQKENVADCATKGRANKTGPKGEMAPKHKLTASQVLEIRHRFASGEHYASIASAYGVHYSTVYHVARKATWSWL
jgi:DNA invertase Pin-like site-specific DNA recombinase